jgi:hypothetical protein
MGLTRSGRSVIVLLDNKNTMCKHVMKVFMLKHPAIDEGLIIRETGTRCGMERTIPMADAFGSTEQDNDGEDKVKFVSVFYPPCRAPLQRHARNTKGTRGTLE